MEIINCLERCCNGIKLEWCSFLLMWFLFVNRARLSVSDTDIARGKNRNKKNFEKQHLTFKISSVVWWLFFLILWGVLEWGMCFGEGHCHRVLGWQNSATYSLSQPLSLGIINGYDLISCFFVHTFPSVTISLCICLILLSLLCSQL